MTKKEKFLALVSKEKTNTLEKNRERIKNRDMLRESQQIAIKVLKRLDEIKWSQKALAEALEVSPQQVTKIVSGKENMTIETQVKLQNILNIPILASFYENREKETQEKVIALATKIAYSQVAQNQLPQNYRAGKTLTMQRTKFSKEHFDVAM